MNLIKIKKFNNYRNKNFLFVAIKLKVYCLKYKKEEK